MLKNEERIARDKIHIYEVDPTIGIRLRPRKKTYINNDNAIKLLVGNFDELNNPTNDQIINHLRAIQYRLMRNDFENWNELN